jgi:hypothetical protein
VQGAKLRLVRMMHHFGNDLRPFCRPADDTQVKMVSLRWKRCAELCLPTMFVGL